MQFEKAVLRLFLHNLLRQEVKIRGNFTSFFQVALLDQAELTNHLIVAEAEKIDILRAMAFLLAVALVKVAVLLLLVVGCETLQDAEVDWEFLVYGA